MSITVNVCDFLLHVCVFVYVCVRERECESTWLDEWNFETLQSEMLAHTVFEGKFPLRWKVHYKRMSSNEFQHLKDPSRNLTDAIFVSAIHLTWLDSERVHEPQGRKHFRAENAV